MICTGKNRQVQIKPFVNRRISTKDYIVEKYTSCSNLTVIMLQTLLCCNAYQFDFEVSAVYMISVYQKTCIGNRQ